jgi:hypothetical protein
MKKRVIALSVAAALGGVAGTATAQVTADSLVFNPAGVGHILIVPYFSTQSGNATLLNIVNTDTVRGKAVKVRFRGASNSDDIFDFQLFLSPGDVWTANVSQGAGGLSALATSDRSCTLPANINQAFITARLNPDLTGDDLANETREGYIEILNMGDIPSGGSGTLYSAIKHNASGTAPCTASVLESLTNFDSRITFPTTGLMANTTLINVPLTRVWTSEAAAIEGRISGTGTPQAGDLPGTGAQVYFRQTATPLTAGDVAAFTADPLFRAGIVAGANFDVPDLSTPYTLASGGVPQLQANDLSYSMSSRVFSGEYLSDPTISAATDWVVSKPTRRYYVAVDYSGPDLIDNFNDNVDGLAVYYRRAVGTPAPAAGGNVVLGTGPSGNGGKTYQGCVQVNSVSFFNREELQPQGSDIVISPGQPTPAPSLCGEVSVLGINSAASSPVSASVARFNLQLPSGFVDGWGSITANNPLGGANFGLPILGAQYVSAFNPAVAAGVSGNFGGIWSLRNLVHGDAPPLVLP